MGKLRNTLILDARGFPNDCVRSAAFSAVVHEVCTEEGLRPPGWIAVLSQNDRRSNALAIRAGREGSGCLVISPSLIDDLTDAELRFVVRHELSHYRHGEARWSLLQAFACLSPFMVYAYGWAINQAVGDVLTLVLYFLALFAHTQAFHSKRYFERRADREAIRNAEDAISAKQALLKVSTIKKRHALQLNVEESDQVIAEFEKEAHVEPDFSNRLFNRIWGTHPLIQERLAMYEKLAESTEWK